METKEQGNLCQHQFLKNNNKLLYCGNKCKENEKYCYKHIKREHHKLYKCTSWMHNKENKSKKIPCDKYTYSETKKCTIHYKTNKKNQVS